jgi:5-methyltetrahydrofolate--homocysteine methyltransferase
MKREEFRQWLKEERVILDGATGTELAKLGLPEGVSPEAWVFENPEAIATVQRRYQQAGSGLVYSPTFGGNRFKLEEFGLGDKLQTINETLARRAKQVLGSSTRVFGDLAPTGRFVEPFGNLGFEDAVACFKEQAEALAQGGVDGFVIETMMDIQEARAALIAVRELGDFPVMVSMTFDKSGHTLNGTDPVSALVTLQSLGADAVGCNCSTGPADMLEIIRQLKPHATVPLLAKPNAGMPMLRDGQTVFDMGPDEFAAFGPQFMEAGVNLIGGCCGTTPTHIAALSKSTGGLKPLPPVHSSISAISSARATVFPGARSPFAVVGERINPTGKKALQAELRDGKFSLLKQYAMEQARQGASVLDVNMGLSGINEHEMMLSAIRLLARFTERPLCIDTTVPEVMEAALRLYPGRALVNSVSGEQERLERTLPSAARYGAMFIGLPLTDAGIPETCGERIGVLETLMRHAEPLGLTTDDLVVDGLVMTISSSPGAAMETLNLIEWVSDTLRSNTIVGLSNVSFGMPKRGWVNGAFLGMAMGRGLTMAIANPSSDVLMGAVQASNAIRGVDFSMLERLGALVE